MKLIVGLGNPGTSFKHTRHNTGFRVLDDLASSLNIRFRRNIFLKAHLVRKDDLILAKPYTFMNLSGTSLRKIKDKFSLKLEDILVVCDDLNLPLGKIRLRKSGSPGGHKGLSSIIEALESNNLPRLRIGVGSSEALKEDTSNFVLSRIPKKDSPKIQEAISRASDCCLYWDGADIEKVMSKFNP